MTYLVNRRQITVQWGDCDPNGMLFNSRVFEYFDTGAWALFQAALGVKPSDLGRTFDIMGIPLVDARANFMLPLKFGDTVDILSSIKEFRRSSFAVEHRLLVDGALAVEGSEVRVWATADKDDAAKLKSLPIPADIMERFKAR